MARVFISPRPAASRPNARLRVDTAAPRRSGPSRRRRRVLPIRAATALSRLRPARSPGKGVTTAQSLRSGRPHGSGASPRGPWGQRARPSTAPAPWLDRSGRIPPVSCIRSTGSLIERSIQSGSRERRMPGLPSGLRSIPPTSRGGMPPSRRPPLPWQSDAARAPSARRPNSAHSHPPTSKPPTSKPAEPLSGSLLFARAETAAPRPGPPRPGPALDPGRRRSGSKIHVASSSTHQMNR